MPRFLRRLVWDISSATPPFKGKIRFISMVSRPNKPDLIRVNRGGVSWLLQGHDLLEFRIAACEKQSPQVNRALNREIAEKRHRVVWDIGANIGGVSLPLLSENKELVSVMFEPSAEVAGRLVRNLISNPHLLERAIVMNVALSDSERLVKFFPSNEPDNSGTAGMAHSFNRVKFPVTVQSYTGDALIAAGACPAPDIMKIDVEGFEIDVLKGLTSTLTRIHPAIVFEHSRYRLKELDRPADEVTNFLRGLGYEVFRLDNGKPVSTSDFDSETDFLAKKI